ncbi:Hypothetical_protein [Hexamita inflata]|uniref:Hypothetical_protein n=1 Tax=Hexamita inflata TaxID=28002 RepID=A0AA86UCN1_9EUKA|nr:Hypothetical protein HINF_LOCUS33422 [Hexamita inflata]
MITLCLKYFSVPIICKNLFTISPGLFPCIQSISVHNSSLFCSEMLSKYMHIQNDFWQYFLSYRSSLLPYNQVNVNPEVILSVHSKARSSTCTNEHCQKIKELSLIKQFSPLLKLLLDESDHQVVLWQEFI